jgi:CubicO group peptidase (beta-lactamase class C family)
MKKFTLGILLLVSQLTFANTPAKKDYDDVLERYIDTAGPGVAVIVTQKGKTLYKNARGMANIELQVPLKTDSVFRLGSITKQFTGAAIMILLEQR